MTAYETIITAIANLYTMLTVHRGLEAQPEVSAVFGVWPTVSLLPMDTPHFAAVCQSICRLCLLPPNELETDESRIALRARNLLFVQPERERAHSGIRYSLALVVLTAKSGQESMTKLDLARLHMHNSVESLRANGLQVRGARVLRLVVGRSMKNIVPTTIDNQNVSTEVWFTSELQFNVMQHALVPRHRVYANMSAEERAELPDSTRKAAEGDVSKLDVLRVTDAVARWCNYVPGQVICIDRRHLFEGGVGFALRCVR